MPMRLIEQQLRNLHMQMNLALVCKPAVLTRYKAKVKRSRPAWQGVTLRPRTIIFASVFEVPLFDLAGINKKSAWGLITKKS